MEILYLENMSKKMRSFSSKSDKNLVLHIMSSIEQGLGTNILQNIIYLILDMGYQMDIFYNQNSKSIWVIVNDSNKHKAMIWIKKLLIKKNSI